MIWSKHLKRKRMSKANKYYALDNRSGKLQKNGGKDLTVLPSEADTYSRTEALRRSWPLLTAGNWRTLIRKRERYPIIAVPVGDLISEGIVRDLEEQRKETIQFTEYEGSYVE